MLQGLTKMEEYNTDMPPSSKDEHSVSSRRFPADQTQANLARVNVAAGWGRSISTAAGFYERIEDGKDFNGQVAEHNNTVIHIPSFPIDHTFRVGFSILNLTGQPVRYLQQWSNGKKTVQYLNDNERGLLNFVAAQTLIRNGTIVEETFDVQQDHASHDSRERNKKKLVGNHVALQVCGYRWLHSVQADELGTRFEDLAPVLGRVNPSLIGDEDIISRLLKLMVEVVPYCGGRMLRLHSVFTVRNNTSHKIHILAKEPEAVDEGSNDYMSANNTNYQHANRNKEIPFELDAGEDLHIPIALLHRSIIASRGASLGSLFVKPTELTPIEEELESRLDLAVGQVDYSPDPINLLQIATTNRLQGIGRNNASDVMQLCCHVNPKHRGNKRARRGPTKNISKDAAALETESNNTPLGNGDSPFGPLSSPSNDFNKLPPFCYNVEIASALKAEFVNRNFFTPNNISPSNPCNFTIVIHPPIQIENLLSCSAVFEIVHAVQKRVLWSACVAPGCVKPIHTVTLEEPLLLLINLRYCRASEGVVIHEPKKNDVHKKGLAKKLQRTLEGFLEENDREEVLCMNLTDTEGQKLRLHVENNEGAGGQKHIVVYCPYWIVNTSQYSYRIREEGEIDLPAGTQTLQKDGTRPIPSSISSFPDESNLVSSRFSTPNVKPTQRNERRGSMGHSLPAMSGNAGSIMKKVDVVFPGCRGPLHHADMRVKNADGVAGIPMTDPLCRLLNELSFEDILCLAYMFNFREDSTILNNGKKVKFQLEDTDWSRSFSLESVGVNQVLQVEDSQKGMLEVGFKISVAPGRLAKYTKIVRLLPRYTIVNALKNDRLVKIIQPDGFVEGKGGGDVIITPNALISYHLPVLFGERKMSLQLEGPWKKTVPFNIDQIGTFTLEVKRHFDLASIPHVNTRGAPEYSVELPANRTIGIFFETDWGEKNIVVKGFQKGGFAEQETDIKVGDVLISVDHEPVDGKKFELAMNILKNRLTRDSCVIKLRTVEEKLRMIRDEAMKNTKGKTRTTRFGTTNLPSPSVALSPKSMSSEGNNQFVDLEAEELTSIAVKVELRPVESSIMVIVNELDKDSNTDYRIENRSGAYRIHFKQKGVNGNSWTTLHPGQTCAFVWEDPFKPHKLQLHVGDNVLCPSDNRNSRYLKEVGDSTDRSAGVAEDKLGMYLSFIGVGGDSATVLNLDEIGSETLLPINRSDSHLLATIKSEGPTKILYILPNLDPKIIAHELQYCSSFAQMKNVEIQKCIQYLQSIQDAMLDAAALRIGNVSETIQLYVHDALEQLRTTQRNELKSLGGFGMAERALDAVSGPAQKLPTDLVTPKYIERLIEAGIDHPHQLLVDILEAKELPALVVGKAEDIYCKLYLKGQERTGFLQ